MEITAVKIEDAILEAAEKSNKLNRLQMFRLRNIMKGPFRWRAKKEITDSVTVQLLSGGLIAVNEEGDVHAMVDWEAIIAFLERLIPLIITLIGLFG